MDALTALHTRYSSPRLSGPEPSSTELEKIYRAAFRAADHGLLQPWRFLQIRGEARARLGELFVDVATSMEPHMPEAQQDKLRQKPLRAPLIIVSVSSPKAHPKVPEFEQDFSAAAATQSMLVACHALGIGAIWRTGPMARHQLVKQGLGLTQAEKIIGFVYLGQPDGPPRPISAVDIQQFVQDWQ
ncbi:MAG: nitroreductase [Gammaproteobacteria bacterium]|nr:nitroreductase [Gammaproteobacteria bacterium]MCY4356470.1 nitroreductase [Gammaproteobacteria bacterium]